MHRGQRAVAYLRVSVVGDRTKRGRFESPTDQRAAIDGWCDQRGIEIVSEVRDLNRSGGTLTRPGLADAMQQVRIGVANGIVVARSDRASRRTVDGLGLIEQLEGLGGWIAAADGSIDTSDRVTRMATTMMLAVGQEELERIKEQSAETHRRAILERGRHMGPAPFGYQRDADGRLIADPDREPIVQRIFERRADGVGWVELSRELERAGVRQTNGRLLNPHMLRRLVARRVYLGQASHGEHVRLDSHPAIVKPAQWAAANRAAPTVRSRSANGRAHPESLLRGLLRCFGCRYGLKRQPSRSGKPPRWSCRSVLTERSATHECVAPVRVRQSESADLEKLVVAALMGLATGVAAERTPAEAEDAERRLADAEALLDELSALEVRRELGAKRWSRMLGDARAEVDRAERDLAASRASAGVDVVALESGWEGMTLDERQSALRSIVQAVMVENGSGSIADRLHVVPVWEAVDLPRPGSGDFVARPFGQD